MFRIAIITLTVFALNMASGQSAVFDKKVEQLFFNVDISNRFVSLIDSLAKIKLLVYKKPEGYTVYPFTGKAWRHYFIFTKHPFLKSRFDTGKIEVQVNDDGTGKKVDEIWWSLWFHKKEDATKSFDELVKFLSTVGTISRKEHSGLAIKEVEFSNIESKKYPSLFLSLGDNKNFDKMYNIAFFYSNRQDQFPE